MKRKLINVGESILLSITIILALIWITLGISGAFVSAFGLNIGLIIGLLITISVYLFLISPYLTIFESRAIGLIYEPLDGDD